MADLKDILGDAKGLAQKSFDLMQDKTRKAADWVADKAKAYAEGGARTAQVTPPASPAPAPTGAAPAPAPAVQPAYDVKTSPIRAAAAGAQPAVTPDEFTKLYDPARLKAAGYNVSPEAAARAAQNAAPPPPPAAPAGAQPGSVRSASPYGDAFRANGSAEAQQWRAAQGAPQAPQPQVPQAGARGALSRIGGAAGTLIGGAAAGSAAFEAGKQAINPTATEDFRKEFGLPATSAVGRGLRAVGVPENAAQFGDDVAVRLAGVGSRVANAATFGLAGLAGDAGAATAQQPAAQPVVSAPIVPPAASPAADSRLKNAPAGIDTAENIVKNRGVADSGEIIPEGTGAIKVGNNPARMIDSRGARDNSQVRPRTLAENMGAVTGGIAKYKGEQFEAAKKASEDKRSILQQNADTATAKVRLEGREMNRKTVEARAENEARRDPELAKIKDKDEYERAVKARASDVSARMDYSVGRRNAGKGDMSPAAVNDFMDAEKWRKAIEKSREGWIQTGRDFIGDKRFDSQDSFSYRPAYVDKSGRIYSENGNSIGHTDSWRQSNWFSPNVIDADMRRYVMNLPTKEEFEAARKKGAK